jgi:hypothetical protein
MSSTVQDAKSEHEHRSSDDGVGPVEDAVAPVVDASQSIHQSDTDMSHQDDEEEADAGSSQAMTGKGAKPTVDVTEQQEHKIVEFYQHNPFYYDQTTKGYKQKSRKLALLETLGQEIGLTGES